MRRVAITGLGALSAIGNDVDSYWQGLLNGQNGIDFLTRFDSAEHKAKLAAEIKNFDPSQYMEPGEARRCDLFAQYAMAAACQAMTNSGLTGNIEPRRLGVYFGSGIGGINIFAEEVQKLLERGPRRISPYFIPMLIANMAAGAIAIRFNAQGPCLPVTTACATSTNAIGEAFHAIKHGYADAVIAGGAESAVTPVGVAGFANMMALSLATDKNVASLPFDKRRNGFVIGEGAGALILEEYQHALARKATIYAEIKGYGSTCDAYHVTAPHPQALGAAEAIRLAVEEAGLADEERIYINAHGTGTPLNDAMETLAIKQAFGAKAALLPVSSCKSMIGHTLGAAGALEAIAAVLALKEGVVPPTINLHEPDPDCDLDYVPHTRRVYQSRAALSLSFGFGGHNAAIALAKWEV